MLKTMQVTKDKALEILKAIIVAKILKIEKHPNADRLSLVEVDFGGKQKQLVTGASNMQVDDLVPFLDKGNVIPGYLFSDGQEIVLQTKKLRGVDSDAMILAEDEIGLSGDHEGIMILDVAEDMIGKSILEILTDEQLQTILNRAGIVEITPALQEKLDLIRSVANYGGEIVGEDALPAILTSGEKLITYDGFEPSGQMHIAQGIIRAINTNKMIKAGFHFKMLVADWYGYINNKMGGDLEKIKTVGKYFIEIWRASGMDLDHTEFIWFSDIVDDAKYWELVVQIAKENSLKRIIKSTEIMGRTESDNLSAAQIMYPCMQAADVFHTIGCQVTELGLDQRKANMIAREVGEKLGYWKPVVVSHGMLQGLGKPPSENTVYKMETSSINREKWGRVNSELSLHAMLTKDNKKLELWFKSVRNDSKYAEDVPLLLEVKEGAKSEFAHHRISAEIVDVKVTHDDVLFIQYLVSAPTPTADRAIAQKMSKSKPDTAIFMTDSREEIERKIRQAYCPEGEVENNPILDYCRQIVFEAHHLKGQEGLLADGFQVKRPEKFGGDVTYSSYQELEEDYTVKNLFPLDLKNAVVEYLDQLVKPVRDHFEQDAEAKKLLEQVQGFQVTR